MTASDRSSPSLPASGSIPEKGASPSALGADSTRENSFLGRVWLHLRAWMPFLANPQDRRCVVRYEPRDARKSFAWTVILPQQCWKCGRRDSLAVARFDETLVVYDQPVMIVSVAFAVSVMLMFMTICISDFLLPAILLVAVVIAGAFLLMRFKRWNESVRLHVFTCPDDASELSRPEMIVHDEVLHVFLATPELAKAANIDLKERRRQGGKPAEGPPAGASAFTPPPPVSSPPVEVDDATIEKAMRRGAPPEDLPPIKIAGEDDDDFSPPKRPSSSPQPPARSSPQRSLQPQPPRKPPSDPDNSPLPLAEDPKRPWYEDP